MACNLNFNQCNLGNSYPRPIFNCRCRLLSVLNSSNLTVVNPTIFNSSALLSSVFTQNVATNGVVQTNLAFVNGDSILLNNGSFMLAEGRYLVSYSISGRISANQIFSFALNENGFLIESSQSSMSGVVGGMASLTNSAIINVTAVSSSIGLVNTNSIDQEVESGNITIQKL